MNTRYRWSASVDSAELNGDWIIMDAEQSTITKLGEVGGFVWTTLQQPTTIAELVTRVTGVYEVGPTQAEQDVIRFITELKNIGLVETTS